MNHPSQKIIGFVATGDELTCGDVLNSTGPAMAQQLQPLGFALPYHFIVDDEQDHIVQAIRTIENHCDIIIISGGLGPTSDDRTRFALAEVLKLPLVQDDATWENLVARLKKAQLPIDECNRQQALFPEGATILPNPHGTAAGCSIEHEGKIFYLLPGPPSECLPMFRDFVLPNLKPYASPYAASKWLLLGVSEGEIASKLDAAVAELDCRTGYRWDYPYLEYKIFATDDTVLQQACTHCLPLVKPYLVSTQNQTATEQLIEYCGQKNLFLCLPKTNLNDRYQALFNEKEKRQLLRDNADNTIIVNLLGFNEWLQNDIELPICCQLVLELEYQGKKTKIKVPLYYRDNRIGNFIKEKCSQNLLGFISNFC